MKWIDIKDCCPTLHITLAQGMSSSQANGMMMSVQNRLVMMMTIMMIGDDDDIYDAFDEDGDDANHNCPCPGHLLFKGNLDDDVFIDW